MKNQFNPLDMAVDAYDCLCDMRIILMEEIMGPKKYNEALYQEIGELVKKTFLATVELPSERSRAARIRMIRKSFVEEQKKKTWADETSL